MQTEEVVPRAQSTGLDDSTSELTSPLQPPSSLRFSQNCKQTSSPPLPPVSPLFTLNMAVKQEPQEEDEPARQTSTFSPQTEIDDAQSVPDVAINHLRIPSQTGPEVPENARLSQQLQAPCSKPASRGRRKSRWKLKFHHQALPPEYLDHYEAALAQEAALNSASASTHPALESSATPPSGDVQTWLQRLAAMQNDVYPSSQREICRTTASRRSVITSTQASPLASAAGPFGLLPQRQGASAQQPSPRPPMKYSDLPYMGEITLDNSKPRRGRKPKKADICHLIYKNYGTILPGTPGLEDRVPEPPVPGKPQLGEAIQLPAAFQRTDIQNRISSLLEKRLTQERRAYEVSIEAVSREQNEPLNLCVRDLNFLKIRLPEGQFFEPRTDGSSDVEDVEILSSLTAASCRRNVDSQDHRQAEVNGSPLIGELEADSRNGLVESNNNQLEKCNGQSQNGESNGLESKQPNSDLLYWPNAGVFIHPAALQSQFLYYQKLAQDKAQTSGQASEQSVPKEQRIVPKSIYSMLENAKPLVPEAGSPETAISPRPKRTASAQSQPSGQQPVKRKRSAIFIPPMPTENNNNPTTEVSICKFKFTGGAKPTLQEKKSLSVDSGGNFRYYSGTGDKSMRGYEFFPREALQQQAQVAAVAGSPGAFTAASPQGDCSADDSRRKRKTRKSIQREKLEQTFKEKGFLIQTQQLESAEGATYCKFRQLRKFTRYLFRSWKDYLPGNVRELNESGEPVAELKDLEIDGEGSLPSPLPPGNLELPAPYIENPSPSFSLH